MESLPPDLTLDTLIEKSFSAKNYTTKTDLSVPKYKFKHNYKPNKKQLNSIINSVLFTNGTDQIEEVSSFSKVSSSLIPVSWFGVDKSMLDIGDNVMLDIDSDSTFLPYFCKFLLVTQGAVYCNRQQVLARDVNIQVGIDQSFTNVNELTKTDIKRPGTRSRRGSWSDYDEYYAVPHYKFRSRQCSTNEKDIQVLFE